MYPLKVLEKQSGFLRLMVYLSNKKEKALTEILYETDISVHQLYSSIEKGKYPAGNLMRITEKGKKVAKKIGEILVLLDNY